MSKLFLKLSTSLLGSGYSIEFRARGCSMYPTIRDGEKITVEPVVLSTVKRGDILLYQNHTGVIAHRVVNMKKYGRYLLRGDASNSLDAPVMPHQILGKVITTERAGQKVELHKRIMTNVLHAQMFRLLRSVLQRLYFLFFCEDFGQILHHYVLNDDGRCEMRDARTSQAIPTHRASRISHCLIIVFLIAMTRLAEPATIDSIRISSNQTSYSIHLKGQGELNCNPELLNDPLRIVLDFLNVKNNFRQNVFQPKNNPFVSRIRSFEHSEDGKNFSRFVVDLKMPVDYIVTPDSEGLVLRLSQRGSIENKPENTSPKIEVLKSGSFSPPSGIDIYIGSEDLLEITVFELPQFNAISRVSGDGTVTMPLIGSVEVGGLTKKQAEKKVASALEAKYVNNASVSINIKEYKSKQVSLLGAVKNPGPYYILSNRTLLQLLSDAGGLTPQAGAKCFVFRSGAPKIEVDLNELMNSGNEKLNIPIIPGDVINIPLETKVIVYVLGAVRSPGAVEMTASLPVTLLAAIARAGGLTDEANKSKIQIRRKDEKGAETMIKVNIKEILNGKTADVLLQSGDTINVSESFF